jgi:hypothetical protein
MVLGQHPIGGAQVGWDFQTDFFGLYRYCVLCGLSRVPDFLGQLCKNRYKNSMEKLDVSVVLKRQTTWWWTNGKT